MLSTEGATVENGLYCRVWDMCGLLMLLKLDLWDYSFKKTVV